MIKLITGVLFCCGFSLLFFAGESENLDRKPLSVYQLALKAKSDDNGLAIALHTPQSHNSLKKDWLDYRETLISLNRDELFKGLDVLTYKHKKLLVASLNANYPVDPLYSCPPNVLFVMAERSNKQIKDLDLNIVVSAQRKPSQWREINHAANSLVRLAYEH